MNKKNYSFIIFFLLFGSLSYFYYRFDFHLDNHSLFLSLSTFLFAIFSGFFISRQSRRYSQLRDEISRFDGSSSVLYRFSGLFGSKMQEGIKKILTKHYNLILKNKAWDYSLTHNTTTITDMMLLIEKAIGDRTLKSIKSSGLTSLFKSFTFMELSRKKMYILRLERIPFLQWWLLTSLAAILLISIGAIDSTGLIISAMLKGAFSTSILLVLVILYEFNNLKFFENTIGERSAQDVLDIMSKRR